MKKIQLFALLSMYVMTLTQSSAQNTSPKEVLPSILEEKTHFQHPLNLDNIRAVGTTVRPTIQLREGQEQKMTTNSSRSLSEGEPMVAVDPNDPNRIVVSYMSIGNGSLNMPVYHSEDGGQTWATSSFSTLNKIKTDVETSGQQLLGGGDPVLVYDINGRLWFSYISLTNGTKGLLFICWIAYSDDNGVTFQQDPSGRYLGRAKIVNNMVSANYGNGLLDRQWLVVDHSDGPYRGRMYLSGLFLGNGQSTNPQMTVNYKEKDSTKFPQQFDPISNTSNPQFAHMSTDDNGTLHLVYTTIATGELYYQQSSDGGETFSDPTTIDFLSYDKQSIVKAVHQRENPMPQIASSKDGQTLYVSWTDFENNQSNAYISKSEDGGQTWTMAYDIGQLSEWGDNALMPSIALNSEEDLIVSWYSINDQLEGQFTIGIKRHNQSDFETTPLFTSPELSDFNKYRNNQAFFFGDYWNTTTSGTKSYAVFADGRNNLGPKLYLATTDHFALRTDIVPINVEDFEVVSALPSPATEYVRVQFNRAIQGGIQCQWTDLDGRVIHRETRQLNAKEIVLAIPPNVRQGTYVLRFDRERQTAQKKIIVSR